MMRRPTIWALGVLLATAIATAAAAAPAQAQEPAPTRPRAEELRRRVRERFAERIQRELDLTGDQMRRLRATAGAFGSRRREMEARRRAISEALAAQIRPGLVASPDSASPDSVGKMTDELMALRVRYAESFRDEQAELATYLDPIQRAKITLLRERLLRGAQEFRRRRPPSERRMER